MSNYSNAQNITFSKFLYNQEEIIPTEIDTLNQDEQELLEIEKLDESDINNENLDSLKDSDTISVSPSKLHGRIWVLDNFRNTTYKSWNKRDLLKYNYAGLTDLVNLSLPTYSRHLGYFGQYNNFSLMGSNGFNSLCINSRDISNLSFNSINLEMFSPEMAENIDFYTGSDASILSNRGGSVINLQEAVFNTKTPFTRFWFQDAVTDFVSFDGLISQNLDSNSNFYFGFKTQTSNGIFANTWVNSWNIRSGYRINFDTLSSLSIQYLFNNHGLGLNGGVDFENSQTPYSSLGAVPNFAGMNERTFRNDLSITYSKVFNDNSALTSNIYYTNSELHRQLPNVFLDINENNKNKQVSNIFGFNNKYELQLFKGLILRNGIDLSYNFAQESKFTREINELRYAAFSNAKLDFSDNIIISGGIRFYLENQTNYLNFGAKTLFILNENNNITIDYSITNSPNSNLNVNIDKFESNNLLFAEYRYNNQTQIFKLNTFFRNIADRPIFNFVSNESQVNIILSRYIDQSLLGGFVEFGDRLSNSIFFEFDTLSILFSGNYQIELNDIKYKELPQFWVSISPSYTIRIVESVVKVGIDFKLFGSKTGFNYSPITHSWFENNVNEEITNNGIDAFANAKLGNAIVKLTFQNILNSAFYQVPLYPNLGRNIRLSVFWSFYN